MIAIVGGGVTGLAAAYYAHKAAPGHPITLLEAAERPGGRLQTVDVGGFTFEAGPDSFLTRKPWALELARELGIELIGTNDDRRRIYVLHEGDLHPLPDGMRLTVPVKPGPFIRTPLLSMGGKLRALREPFIPPRRDDKGDESIGAFVRRRFGEEMLRTIAEPLMAGLFVADADELSLHATFPHYARMEREHGSLIRAYRKQVKGSEAAGAGLTMFVTPKAGTQDLVERLAAEVGAHAHLTTGARVTAITKREEGGYTLVLGNGTRMHADAVVITTPAPAAADMLTPLSDTLPDLLRTIPYSSTVTVSLGYDAATFNHPLGGFGFVVPHTEETGLIAATWMSTKFDHRAPPGTVALRAFLGEEVLSWDDDSIVRMAHTQLNRIMRFGEHGATPNPVASAVFRWPKGSPVYTVGHLERVARVEAGLPPGVFLAGNAYRGVGIPDSVRQGKSAGEAAARWVLG
jgi:oxygen-dependent protoporphyrinogen oxidase